MDYYGFGGILADDMGLGKTVQIIGVISDYVCSGKGVKQSLVVCPTSLVYNWQKEIEKFAPGLKSDLIVGPPGKREDALNNSAAHVLITTYDTLKRDIKAYKKKSFKFLIIDEAQYIKNPLTQNSKAIKLVKGDAKFALTGTPIENSLAELWSIFDFIMPGYLYNLSKFNKIYTKPILSGEGTSVQLRSRIKPFILRRTKKEVLTELPDKIESTLYADMTEEQKRIYSAFLFEARGEFDSIKSSGEINRSKIKILALITRLRQICCDPSIIIEDYGGGSGKLETVYELISQSIESGHKILLFSQFTKMLNVIKTHLDDKGVPFYYLDGSVPSKIRSDMCTEFNNGGRDIFLISLKAGGTGLNLTAADIVIHYDPWWNTAVMDQATDRAHRIGQEKVVHVFNVVSKDSIEEKILALQEKKRGLISDVLEEGENFINKMSEQELESLFTYS
jgi:SNF2 family DNA or RNA helicase